MCAFHCILSAFACMPSGLHHRGRLAKADGRPWRAGKVCPPLLQLVYFRLDRGSSRVSRITGGIASAWREEGSSQRFMCLMCNGNTYAFQFRAAGCNSAMTCRLCLQRILYIGKSKKSSKTCTVSTLARTMTQPSSRFCRSCSGCLTRMHRASGVWLRLVSSELMLKMMTAISSRRVSCLSQPTSTYSVILHQSRAVLPQTEYCS